MQWTVRDSASEDEPAILDLVRAAFTNDQHDPSQEVQVVLDTWSLRAAAGGLDLVAADELGKVVGHVLGGIGTLEGRPTLAVAPLAVAPAYQRQGIGIALMTEFIERAEHAQWPMVLLLGNPSYYERFGFERAGRLGISYAKMEPDSPYFMVRCLERYEPTLTGTFTFCWEEPPNR